MSPFVDPPRPPVIDLSLFEAGDPWRDHVAAQIDWAAAEFGLFTLVGHGVDPDLIDRVSALGRRAVSRSEAGIEFDDVHDSRDFTRVPGFREAAGDYLQSLSGLSHRLLTSVGRALQCGDNFFVDHHTGNPRVRWELRRDEGGLQSPPNGLVTIDLPDDATSMHVLYHDAKWVEVPRMPGALVARVGGALERVSKGHYRAVPVRTIARRGEPGLAAPFAFDAAAKAADRIPARRLLARPTPLVGMETARAGSAATG
jgi:isopenicillin N synthase-like dioxygenase